MKTYTQRAFATRLAELLGISAEPIRAKLKYLKKNGTFTPVEDNGERKGDVYTDEQIETAIELLSKKKTSPDNELTLFAEPPLSNDVDIDDCEEVQPARADLPVYPPVMPVEASLEREPISDTVEAEIAPADVSDDVITLEERAARIRRLQADVQRGIIQIGFELIAAKKEVGHGNWSEWLENEFDWTQQTANRFMRVAERFGKLNNVVQFKPSTLQAMLLLPVGDENEFIAAQADAGTPVEKQSAREVQQSVKAFKAAKAMVAEEPTPDLSNRGETFSVFGRETDDDAAVVSELVTQNSDKQETTADTVAKTAIVTTPAQIHAVRELVTATDDLHELKAIRVSLSDLLKEIDAKIAQKK